MNWEKTRGVAAVLYSEAREKGGREGMGGECVTHQFVSSLVFHNVTDRVTERKRGVERDRITNYF